MQPDMCKTGGLTETLRIAALASAWKLELNPHTMLTGLNMAATLHLLCRIDNPGYFESDISSHNPIRDELCDWKAEVDHDGCAGTAAPTQRTPPASGAGLRSAACRFSADRRAGFV